MVGHAGLLPALAAGGDGARQAAAAPRRRARRAAVSRQFRQGNLVCRTSTRNVSILLAKQF